MEPFLQIHRHTFIHTKTQTNKEIWDQRVRWMKFEVCIVLFSAVPYLCARVSYGFMYKKKRSEFSVSSIITFSK
jgi:hypothetical protein